MNPLFAAYGGDGRFFYEHFPKLSAVDYALLFLVALALVAAWRKKK